MKSLCSFIVSTLLLQTAFAGPHYIIECTIYDEKWRVVKALPGRGCQFLPDGSYIRAEADRIEKISPTGRRVWSQNLNMHHQMNLSGDRRRLLVLSGRNVQEKWCRIRYDELFSLDAGTGRIIGKYSLRDHVEDFLASFPDQRLFWLVRWTGEPLAKGECYREIAHFNSIYEIPANPLEKDLPFLKAGNIIANSASAPYFFFLDKNLKKIVGSISIKPFSSGRLHDAQVLPTGEILFYSGHESKPFLRDLTAIKIHNPQTQETKILFPHEPGGDPTKFEFLGFRIQIDRTTGHNIGVAEHSGGVQILPDGNILTSQNSPQHGGRSVLINPQGKILWIQPYDRVDSKNQKRPEYFQQVKSDDLSSFLQNNAL